MVGRSWAQPLASEGGGIIKTDLNFEPPPPKKKNKTEWGGEDGAGCCFYEMTAPDLVRHSKRRSWIGKESV